MSHPRRHLTLVDPETPATTRDEHCTSSGVVIANEPNGDVWIFTNVDDGDGQRLTDTQFRELVTYGLARLSDHSKRLIADHLALH